MKLTRGAESVSPVIVSIQPERIEAIVPENAPLGDATLTVTRGAEMSNAFPVKIAAASAGIYSRNGAGWGPGRIRSLAPGADNSTSNSAQPGSRISVAMTGSGGQMPALTIGGRRAKTLSLRRAGADDEIVAQIPADAPEGCFVPVYAESPNAAPSNVVTISIRRGGGECRMPPGFPIPLITTPRAGVVIISRLNNQSKSGAQKWIEDEGVAAFAERDAGPAITPFLAAPPPGTCSVFTGSAQSPFLIPTSISSGIVADLGRRGLDVGKAISIRGGGERVLPRTPGAPGYYRAPLGEQDSRHRPLFLSPGEYTVTAPGGPDQPAFELRVAAPKPFTWTNRDAVAVVDRKHPPTLRWSPPTADPVFIVATNVDQFTTARAMCYCVADGRRGEFTIPSAMLANFPVTADVPGEPFNQLVLARLRSVTDARQFLTAASLFANLRAVDFK